jgi:hypothetical protein
MMDLKDYQKIAKESKQVIDDIHKQRDEIQRQELMKRGITIMETTPEERATNFHGDCDHPNTLENGTATLLYIVVMLVGAIFHDRIGIWVITSIIYFNFITRHWN